MKEFSNEKEENDLEEIEFLLLPKSDLIMDLELWEDNMSLIFDKKKISFLKNENMDFLGLECLCKFFNLDIKYEDTKITILENNNDYFEKLEIVLNLQTLDWNLIAGKKNESFTNSLNIISKYIFKHFIKYGINMGEINTFVFNTFYDYKAGNIEIASYMGDLLTKFKDRVILVKFENVFSPIKCYEIQKYENLGNVRYSDEISNPELYLL